MNSHRASRGVSGLLGLALIGPVWVLAPAAVYAEVARYHVSLTPFVGYQIGGEFKDDDTGDKISLDDASSFGLIINAPADDTTEYELYLSRQSVGIDQSSVPLDPDLEIDISYIQAGGTYVFEGDPIRPFIAAGIGATHVSPDQSQYSSETYFSFGLGGGVLVFPASRVGLRLEGRLLGTVIDSDSGIFCQSGSQGATCAIRASGDILWQWEMFAGVTARF